ncbi:NAD(P)/FAD-dependent oxidoreductase [Pararhizobium gei]|uniref:NAD(P)/FAD-dependent oxidoreductase n=1 Tax=Pararhizobium gei TaxID=1395951 RepID=UPI0023DA7D23|nr:FAD-binding oxidoreductase [Rhizobium gei]
MQEKFDFIIVGKGMMGAAAARHLAVAGASIALVGPDEPAVWASHDGVFSSHYDNGRITRTIDPDSVWARLARRSIERYGDIENASGIKFYSESGCLIVAPPPGGADAEIENVIAARDRLGVEAPFIDTAGLASRFPSFRFPPGYCGVYEPRNAGHINPRALVAAQVLLAERTGVKIFRDEVIAIDEFRDGVEVRLNHGRSLTGGRVLVAAGGFSISDKLMKRPLDLTVKARTVVFAEVAEADLPRLSGIPSLITSAPEQDESYYLLPPILYPDGKWYIKIGGDPSDIDLQDEAGIRTWFRGEGNRAAVDHMAGLLKGAMPSFTPAKFAWAPCVTTFTRHGYPYIGFAGSDRIAVLTGGNGMAAKSSDEIGRLGATLLANGVLDAPEYETDFAVCTK